MIYYYLVAQCVWVVNTFFFDHVRTNHIHVWRIESVHLFESITSNLSSNVTYWLHNIIKYDVVQTRPKSENRSNNRVLIYRIAICNTNRMRIVLSKIFYRLQKKYVLPICTKMLFFFKPWVRWFPKIEYRITSVLDYSKTNGANKTWIISTVLRASGNPFLH